LLTDVDEDASRSHSSSVACHGCFIDYHSALAHDRKVRNQGLIGMISTQSFIPGHDSDASPQAAFRTSTSAVAAGLDGALVSTEDASALVSAAIQSPNIPNNVNPAMIIPHAVSMIPSLGYW
jgi:hypothetical protein